MIVYFQLSPIAKVSNKDNYADTDILMDKGYICSFFNNNKILLNVRESGKTLMAYTNGGHQDSSEETCLQFLRGMP